MLCSARAAGADEPSLSNQLTNLGRQALLQGAQETAARTS
jgi:hypothetical protein